MTSSKTKVVYLVTISLIVLAVVCFIIPNKYTIIKPYTKHVKSKVINNSGNTPAGIIRYPKTDTQYIIKIYNQSNEDSYVVEDIESNTYLEILLFTHKSGDEFQKYTSDKCSLEYRMDSCYKYYEISYGEDEIRNKLFLNYKEGKNLYSLLLTPSQNREIVKKIIDDKLFDLPRLDNVDIYSVFEQTDQNYNVLAIGNTSVNSLDSTSKLKINDYFTWFENKYLTELKKNPVEIFPTRIPARADY